MYKVQHTVFGNYVDVDWCDTHDEAMKSAEQLSDEGWMNIRVLTPYGEMIQVYGN